MIKEFKKFISRGNVMELAVGVIIGGAFGKIVTSLVNDILMPIIGIISGGIDFTTLSIKLGEATIFYGNFIQNIIDFLIVALCIFFMMKAMNKFAHLTKEEKEKPKDEKKEKSEEVLLLEEIRDLLKGQKENKKKK